ncbi:TIM barrel protein [Acidobacteria bacterium AB60]|nr:TIM barrel protein [Acidobacteria bacterium AB60]
MTGSTRRDFLKTSGLVAAGACAGVRLEADPLPFPIGLQLYSVRDLLPKDFDGTLHQLSAAGYREVEAAGYFNKTAQDWKHAMDQAGLRCVSTHHPLPMWKQKEDELIEYGKKIGLQFMICSSPMHRDPAAKGPMTLDDWKWVADEFNRIGAKVKSAGMQFGYHNHMGEFEKENGVVFYDELIARTDPKFVMFEMDCGWVYAAGSSPITYLKKFPQRIQMLHVKCMSRGNDGQYHSVVMGRGFPDYHPIFALATNLKHYFVEQEEFKGDAMAELQADAAFMKNFQM